MSFKDFWRTKNAKLPEVRDYRDQMAQARKFQPTGMTNGEDHDTIEQEMGLENKSIVQKPGPSIHTSKWDDCVADVKNKNPGANAFAVCTSQLGEESFKSEFRGLAYTKSLIKNAKRELAKDVGTSFAGPTPNSLLARQDLEGEAMESEANIAAGTGIRTLKSDAASNDELYDIKTDAALAETERQKKSVVTDIKDTQKKRQKAAINMREKSFKGNWKENISNYEG